MFGTPQKKFLKAAANGDVAELNRCLRDETPASYGIEARDGSGRTALILAAKEGKVDTLRILIEKKADIEAADSSGRTALWWAVRNGRSGASKLLLAAGADANTHDNDYYYAMHYAARNGDLDVVKGLAAAGAEINPQIKGYLQTPLYMAVEGRRNPVVEFLLAQGARTDLKDINGYTPYDRAKAYGNKPLQDLIEQAHKRVVPAPPAAIVHAPAAAPPAPARPAEAAGDSWVLLGGDTVAHVNVYPPISRKLTEIFNFSNRERTVITENLKTGTEAMTPPEKFETLAEDAVARAEEQLKALGGAVPDKGQKKAFNL